MPSTTAARQGNGTREQVLDHAAALIRERGFRATSIGDLLQRAGVQKGSFYYYFPSKEDLGHAVLDRWVEELRGRLIDYLSRPDGPAPLERIAAALDGYLTEQEATGCRGGCPFGNLAMELADVHEGFRTRISGALRELSEAFARLVERARAAGDLRGDANPRQIGEFLVAAIEGGILLAKVHKSAEPLGAALRAAEAYVASHRTRAE